MRLEAGPVLMQRLLALGILLGTAVLVHLLAPILTPFLIALAIAYLWDPVVDRLERIGLSRTLGVCVVFLVSTLLVIALTLILIPLLARQMHVVASKIPDAIEWFKTTLLPWLGARFHVSEADIPLERIKEAMIENWQSAGGVAQGLLVSATASSLAVVGWFANLVLVPVVAFYLLRDWDTLLGKVREMLPRAWEPNAVRLAHECDEVVSAFIRGQLLVMLALGVCYTVGLMIVGLDLALLIGIVAGVASIVPYLGLLLGIAAASIAALLQFGELMPVVWVVLVFVVSQMFEGMYLTPKLVGDRIGMHPVVVIFAIMAGGQLFGFSGVLLALPVSAVIMVLLRHVHDRYRASSLYDHASPAVAAEPAAAVPPPQASGEPAPALPDTGGSP